MNDMVFCEQCGGSMSTDDRFCGGCGSAQVAPQPAPNPEPAPEIPLYRPDAVKTSSADAPAATTVRTIGNVLGIVLDGLATVLGMGARLLLVVVWGAAAVLLFQAGEVPIGLGCGAYVLYLVFGGRWFIW